MEHTREPWQASSLDEWLIVGAPVPDQSGQRHGVPVYPAIARVLHRISHGQTQANRQRIVTCVNALTGVDQAALERNELHNLEVALHDLLTSGAFGDSETFVCRAEAARRVFDAFQALWPQQTPGRCDRRCSDAAAPTE